MSHVSFLRSFEQPQLVFYSHPLVAPIKNDGPIPQNVSADQARVVAFLYENGGNNPNRIEATEISVGESNSAGMFSATVGRAKSGYLTAFIGLKQPAVVSKDRAAIRWISEARRIKRNKRTTANDVLVDALWYFIEKTEGRTRDQIRSTIPAAPVEQRPQARITAMPKPKSKR